MKDLPEQLDGWMVSRVAIFVRHVLLDVCLVIIIMHENPFLPIIIIISSYDTHTNT